VSLGCGFVFVVCTDDLRGPLRRTCGALLREVDCFTPLLSAAGVVRLGSVLRSLSARSVRSFLSTCDRASTRPFVDARGPFLYVRARAPKHPTPIKSVRSSRGTPGRSIIKNTPGRNGQVQGTRRAGKEPRGFARQSGESTPSRSRKGPPWVGLSWVLHLSCLTRRTGLRWEPTRAPRQGSKRNEGGPEGSPSFFALCRHSSLSCRR
jgi:hypothetical protein